VARDGAFIIRCGPGEGVGLCVDREVCRGARSCAFSTECLDTAVLRSEAPAVLRCYYRCGLE